MSTKLTIKNNREENEATLRECVKDNQDMADLRESLLGQGIVDIADEKQFPVLNRKFSWKKVKSQCMREANASSTFSQVLRAGVQTVVDSAYQSVKTTFEDWVHVVQSSKDTELYAPLQGISFPKEVGRQEVYPESVAAGLDIKLSNKKYGQVFSVEKELLEDDQTGQFNKQVALIGQYLKLVLEVLCYAKLGGIASQYADMSVPASETKPSKESSYPWSTALVGSGANRPGSFAALSQGKIQDGMIGLMNQLNKLGLRMSVAPSRLIISPRYQFDASILMNSAYYPSGAASAGNTNTGGAFAINPIKGILDVTVSRFVFDNSSPAVTTASGGSKAWYIVDDSVPWFICQVRQASSVLQENPQSGESFNRDVMRFRGSARANADHMDPRFAWQGSDGSV